MYQSYITTSSWFDIHTWEAPITELQVLVLLRLRGNSRIVDLGYTTGIVSAVVENYIFYFTTSKHLNKKLKETHPAADTLL